MEHFFLSFWETYYKYYQTLTFACHPSLDCAERLVTRMTQPINWITGWIFESVMGM